MKCEICKQPILEEGYKYVHPICPKGEDAETHRPKRIRITAPGSGFNIGTEWDVHSVEPPYYKISEDEAVPFSQCELIDIHDLEPELTPEEKEWFEGLEYVRPDDPFPFFRFCPCGSISQHLPIAREQITPIQWIREHYEHRDMEDKVEGEHWTAELFPDFAQLSGDAIAKPVLSVLFFVTKFHMHLSVQDIDTTVFNDAFWKNVNRSPMAEFERGHGWFNTYGESSFFNQIRADVNSCVESLGGEKPSVYKQRVPGENKWDVTIKDDEFTLDDRTMKAIEGWHGSKIYVYEPAAYKAEWTDLTHVYCAYASCGVVESQPKDYSVWRLEVKVK